jgi:hypothetical protein
MGLSKDQKQNLTKEQLRHFKKHGVIPSTVNSQPVPEPVLKTSAPTIDDSKVTVLCVRFGHKYGPEYVERLRNMVSRHMTVPYEFACLTDDRRFMPNVRILYQPSAGYIRPWWHKVHMFDPGLEIQGRILYFDLDVVICGNIDKLASNLGNTFYGIQDFNRKFHPSWKSLNSSVMSWIHGTQNDIWQQFAENKQQAQRLHGDQDWIWRIAKDRIKWWPRDWIQSYKWEFRSREELVVRNGQRGFKTIRDVAVPNGCSVAVFHGDPKPEDLKDSFVVDNWR